MYLVWASPECKLHKASVCVCWGHAQHLFVELKDEKKEGKEEKGNEARERKKKERRRKERKGKREEKKVGSLYSVVLDTNWAVFE